VAGSPLLQTETLRASLLRPPAGVQA